MRTLYSDDDLYVIYRSGTSPFMLVTFNNYATLGDGISYWAQRVVEAMDYTCLGIVARRRSWFPSRSMQPAVAACAEIMEPRPRIGYGLSMGAYGVLKYGAALALDVGLAFSPQATIDPDRVGNVDRRFLDCWPDCDRDMLPGAGDPGARTFVVHDPGFVPDQVHVDLVSGLPGVACVPLHGIGHATHNVLGGSGPVDIMLRLAASDPDRLPSFLADRWEATRPPPK